MVFEQAYGAWLVKELNTAVRKINDNLICKLHDEIGYKPLADNADQIAVVVSGGNAVRSAVSGLDQNVLPLTVTVVCKEEYSTPVRNAIDGVQKAFNAVPMTLTYFDAVTGGQSSTSVKSVFTTPFTFVQTDYKTEKETIKAAFLSFSATVFYGETAVVKPVSATLKIGGEIYEIKHIADYNMSATPAYESYLAQGAERAGQCMLSRTNAFSFTVFKTAGDELQEVFEQELFCAEGGLAGKELFLNFGGELFGITTYQLTESYVNNAASYNLLLCV